MWETGYAPSYRNIMCEKASNMLRSEDNKPGQAKRAITSKQLETEPWFLSAEIDPEDDPDPPPPRRKQPAPTKLK